MKREQCPTHDDQDVLWSVTPKYIRDLSQILADVVAVERKVRHGQSTGHAKDCHETE